MLITSSTVYNHTILTEKDFPILKLEKIDFAWKEYYDYLVELGEPFPNDYYHLYFIHFISKSRNQIMQAIYFLEEFDFISTISTHIFESSRPM